MTSIYNGQCSGNILLVGKTGCGKKTFLEKLGLNKFLRELVKTEWISGIDVNKKREAEIESSFSNEAEVHIAKEPEELDSLTETFKLRSEAEDNKKYIKNVKNLFGENKKMDSLIVMDDVYGVADISKKFANFLTVSRKFGYHCVYVFHVISPSTQIWQKIISQTNIFNIFPASIPHNTVSKILQSSSITQTRKYVPVRSLWLNRVFTDLASSHEKHCLTIDCSYQNKNGPGRYRSSADNPVEQVCYFNKPNDDEYYDIFTSKRIKEERYDNGIYFKIEKVRGRTDREYFDGKKMLEDGTSNVRFSRIFSDAKPEPEHTGAGTKRHGDSIEHLYRRDRKSARPKFLSG